MHKLRSLLLTLCCIDVSLVVTVQGEDTNGGQNPIYVPTPSSIRIVNPATNQIVGAIPIPGTFNLTFSPDVKLGYAIQSDFGVQIVDLQARQVVDFIAGPWNPQAVAVSADGRRLALVDNNSSSVVLISLPAKQVLATIPVGLQPFALKFHPNGRKLYVADHDDNVVNPRVYVIDTATFAITASIPMPHFPSDVAIDSNGERAYVVCEGTPDSSFVVAVDTRTDRVISTLPVLTGATDISIDRENSFGYVSTGGNSGGGILVLNLRENRVVATVVTGDQTFGGSVSQDGDRVYAILLNTQTLIVMDTRTRQIVSSVPLGDFAIHTATSLHPGPAIRVESCLIRYGEHVYTARFGYDNNTGAPRTILAGPDNSVFPGAPDQGQPTFFRQGVVDNSFRVDLDGMPITWAVNSPSGSTYWSTASRHSPVCR